MRDDGTPHDQYGLGGSAVRSDDTPSTDRSTASLKRFAPRLLGLNSLRTRLGRVANPLTARPGRPRLAVATGAVCCLGLVGFAQVGGGATDESPASIQPAQAAERTTPEAASRDAARQTPAPVAETANPDLSPSPTTKPKATTKPKPKATTKPKPKPKPKQIAPVAGLDQAQMNNAKAIVKAGQKMRVPRRALVIAVATAMQESNLYNYASGVLPESQNYPHQAIGWDHDSVGLFQQRPSSGWGAVADLMKPEYATQQFLNVLVTIPGWQNMALTDAAQSVQVSAFPYAYAQHEGRANQVVNAILG